MLRQVCTALCVSDPALEKAFSLSAAHEHLLLFGVSPGVIFIFGPDMLKKGGV